MHGRGEIRLLNVLDVVDFGVDLDELVKMLVEGELSGLRRPGDLDLLTEGLHTLLLPEYCEAKMSCSIRAQGESSDGRELTRHAAADLDVRHRGVAERQDGLSLDKVRHLTVVVNAPGQEARASPQTAQARDERQRDLPSAHEVGHRKGGH